MIKKNLKTLLLLITLAMFLIWLLSTPSLKREWTPDQAIPPQISISDSEVRITNVRNSKYRSISDFDTRYEDRSFNPNDIVRVWYVVELFEKSWRGPAHAFLSFEFGDNRFISVSPEIRKEKDESFSAFWGLFRRFEILYVVADEKDVIGLRVNHRKNPVYLYPMKATKEQAKKMFLDVMTRAKKLTEEPEFYNTFTNSCNTNIVAHVRSIAPKSVPLSWRVLVPGYSDALAFEQGLIDTDLSFEEARRIFQVSKNSPLGDGLPFSVRIRKRLPASIQPEISE